MRGKRTLFLRLGAPAAIGILLFCVLAAQAAPGSCFEAARADLAPLLRRLTEQHGSLAAVQGELSLIWAKGGILRSDRGSEAFRFHRDAVIFVNGRPAGPGAAAPVGPEEFFWAEIWRNRTGEVLVMEAVYCGGELMLITESPRSIAGFVPENGSIMHLAVADHCQRPALLPGDAVYVLLDLEGRIRYLRRL